MWQVENKCVRFTIHYNAVTSFKAEQMKRGDEVNVCWITFELSPISFRSFLTQWPRSHIRVRYRNNCHHKNYDSYFRICFFFSSSLCHFLRYPCLELSLSPLLDCAMCFVCVMKMAKRKLEKKKKNVFCVFYSSAATLDAWNRYSS